eukprot:4090255-Pleurochrysis_carterae.AAC.1
MNSSRGHAGVGAATCWAQSLCGAIKSATCAVVVAVSFPTSFLHNRSLRAEPQKPEPVEAR